MKQRNSFPAAAPLMVLLLGVCLAACEYETPNTTTSSANGGEGGNAGAAGSGNTGGTGGGGMSIPACSTAEGMVAAPLGWPWFGFEEQLPVPGPDFENGAPATVVAIELGGLRLHFDGVSPDPRLAWVGPDLKPVFAVGDMVTVTRDAGVQAYRVSGNKGQAVVMRYANSNVLTMLPAIPGSGPSLSLDLQCLHEEVKSCPMPERRTLYGLTAALGAEMAKIPSGMTGTVGKWQIHHVRSMNIELFNAGDCTPDKIFEGAVQALEVQ
jgi:hypothetical protein